MSMAWMRMQGQSWSGAAAMILGMWVVMMVAMMLPTLAPILWRYRQTVTATGAVRPRRLTTLVAVGYFFVWTLIGAAVFPLGFALAALEMRLPALARAAPIAAGLVILIAGSLQFTRWKLRHLACCRTTAVCSRPLPDNDWTAWRYGMRLGVHCAQCCAGLIAILLVIGVMNLGAMAIIAAAITVERVMPAAGRVARIIGAVIATTGLLMIAITLLPALRA
jgi:predicted metal-binding membrane protein